MKVHWGGCPAVEPSVYQTSGRIVSRPSFIGDGCLYIKCVSREACSEIGHESQDSVHLLAKGAGCKGAALL